ncbi:MAG: hypothetical protein PHY26_03610 [Bacilli bacterium]|nr:hypothetical protein [Bacilli bacterium]
MFIIYTYKLMQKATLSIILMVIFATTLSGCSSDKANDDFNKKQDCAAQLTQFTKNVEQYDLTPSYLITTDNISVFYSNKLNTCIGSYSVKTTHDKTYAPTETDKELGFIPAPELVNKTQYVIKDLLTNVDVFNQTFTDENKTENTPEKDFNNKINELKQ